MAKAKIEGERVTFRCPGCEGVYRTNNPDYEESTVRLFASHQIDPSRWRFSGDVENPTFEPSVLVKGGEHDTVCHSFVKDGKIQYLGDCTHAMANQTVELPEI